MKGVILAGGFAKRMSPCSKTINKHLMPVYIKNYGAIPMIYFPINTLINSGIKEILIITSDEAAGLMIDSLGDGRKFGDGVDFTYKIQNMHDATRPIGIAGALKLAKSFTNNEKFAVILGDNFYEDSFIQEIEDFSNNDYLGHIFLKGVVDPERFGVATINDKKEVIELIEKPKDPKSIYASTGLYLFDKCVYNIAETLVVSNRKELEIVDIHNKLIAQNKLKASFIKNFWHDLGTPQSIKTAEEYIEINNFKLSFSF